MVNTVMNLFFMKCFWKTRYVMLSVSYMLFVVYTLCCRTPLTISCCSTTSSTWMRPVRRVRPTWRARTGWTWSTSKTRPPSTEMRATVPHLWRTQRGRGNIIKVRPSLYNLSEALSSGPQKMPNSFRLQVTGHLIGQLSLASY